MDILRRALKIVSELNIHRGVTSEIQEIGDKESGIWNKAKKSYFPQRYSDSNTQLYFIDAIVME